MGIRFVVILCGLRLLFSAGLPALASAQNGGKDQGAIQDNSFLVEEAYNQERGVVQHIHTFSRMWNSKDWAYSFTQEWPIPSHWRHQVSYTLTGAHAGAFPASGAGLGDVAVHYRYQLAGDGDSRVAFAPRLSALLPTGNAARGRGAGGAGIQGNLPVSVAVQPRLVTHWNLGATYVANAQGAGGYRAATFGRTVAESVVFLASPRVNLLVECADTRFQSVARPGGTEWMRTTYISPGIRWAHNFRSGLQIVPGVATPVGIGASAGERGIFLYLSLEHSLGRRSSQ